MKHIVAADAQDLELKPSGRAAVIVALLVLQKRFAVQTEKRAQFAHVDARPIASSDGLVVGVHGAPLVLQQRPLAVAAGELAKQRRHLAVVQVRQNGAIRVRVEVEIARQVPQAVRRSVSRRRPPARVCHRRRRLQSLVRLQFLVGFHADALKPVLVRDPRRRRQHFANRPSADFAMSTTLCFTERGRDNLVHGRRSFFHKKKRHENQNTI